MRIKVELSADKYQQLIQRLSITSYWGRVEMPRHVRQQLKHEFLALTGKKLHVSTSTSTAYVFCNSEAEAIEFKLRWC